MLGGGARYYAEQVPSDDLIAEMYGAAVKWLGVAGLEQYEISNFCRPGFESRHNLRYWQRRPYLGLGLDASSMLREAEGNGSGFVLRATTSDDLNAFLVKPEPSETAWLSPDRQHEEAWFLGLRLNAGVDVVALEREFGEKKALRAMGTVRRLVDDGLLSTDGERVRLTPLGRLLSNDVFQEFLVAGDGEECVTV
jgi:oxygen-independent coproporphyrinogen-3 oxidase